MRRSSVKEYTETMGERYWGASKLKEGLLLDEIVQVTGYHRKSAFRLLSGKSSSGSTRRRGRSAVNGAEVRDGLRTVWEASDRLCGKRLAPFARELSERLAEHGEPRVTEEVMGQV